MRITRVLLAALLASSLLVAGTGCREKTVTVTSGEIVLCTEGEIVSDTTESIEVPADEVADHSVSTRVITCDLHSKIAGLYAAAQDAIAAGDLEEAQRILAEVLAGDPLYRRASAQLEEIKAGRAPAPDGQAAVPTPDPGTTPAQDPKPGDAEPTGPVLNLVGYVPDTLPGFAGQGLVADPFVLTRYYLPTSEGSMSSLVIVVEQFKDAAMAQRDLDQILKPTYPGSGAAVSVKGAPGYFGNNQDVAIVAFVQGALLIAVEGGPTTGNPASLKSDLLGIAGQIAK